MMTEQISFTDLVRMIHPDSNPEIQDAGAKMSLATKNRNNPHELFRLAVRWGLIEGKVEDKIFSIKIGSVLQFTTGRRVIVVAFDRHLVIMVDLVTNSAFQFACTEREKYENSFHSAGGAEFIIVGKASSVQFTQALRVLDRLRREFEEDVHRNRRERQNRERRAEDSDEYVWQFLYKNYNYRNRDIWVVHKSGRRVKVTRTTSKSVFYWDNFRGKERRFAASTIGAVIVND